MGNLRDLYNSKFKKVFLNQSGFTKATRSNYEYVLSKAYKWESRLGKDLSEFNNEEYDKVLTDLQAVSERSIQYQHSILLNYITFAIQSGFSKQQINFAKNFSGKMLENYVDSVWTENEFITKEQLDDIIGICENMQDAAIPILIYYVGISNNLEEIRNLKGKDVNTVNNTIRLTKDNGESKIIKLESQYIDVLYEANLESEYKKSNGEEDITAKAKITQLQPSEYVIKNRIRKDAKSDRVTAQLIRQRLQRVREWANNKYLTPTSVMVSGMVEYTKQYMLTHDKKVDDLSMYDYIKIIDRFGIGEVNWYTNKIRIMKHLKG